jgi:hypothetical protein
MRFRDGIHATNDEHIEMPPESDDREIREFWRELARPVTLFDLCSPSIFFGSKIGGFVRKWCARRDSNAGPPA